MARIPAHAIEKDFLPQVNFRHWEYLPGRLMAERCNLLVFHGGHSSVMTALQAGTPAVVIPTISERESNARRLESLRAGEVVMPEVSADGEKHVNPTKFGEKVMRVLKEPSYRQSPRGLSDAMRKFKGSDGAAHRTEDFLFSR